MELRSSQRRRRHFGYVGFDSFGYHISDRFGYHVFDRFG